MTTQTPTKSMRNVQFVGGALSTGIGLAWVMFGLVGFMMPGLLGGGEPTMDKLKAIMKEIWPAIPLLLAGIIIWLKNWISWFGWFCSLAASAVWLNKSAHTFQSLIREIGWSNNYWQNWLMIQVVFLWLPCIALFIIFALFLRQVVTKRPPVPPNIPTPRPLS